jgi:hypothetical protein
VVKHSNQQLFEKMRFPNNFCFRGITIFWFLVFFHAEGSIENMVIEASRELYSFASDPDLSMVEDVRIIGSPSSYGSLHKNRFQILRSQEDSRSHIHIKTRISGFACQEGYTLSNYLTVELSIDGNVTSKCYACNCILDLGRVADGPHMIKVSVVHDSRKIVAYRCLLLSFTTRRPKVDNFESERPWEKVLREYTELHRRILDPNDMSVPKKFLVVSSSHGLANTQIEEVNQSRPEFSKNLIFKLTERLG